MAFREVRVFEVREVLRLWLAGEGIRATEPLVGFDRKTVRRYVDAAVGLGLVRDGGDEQDQRGGVVHQTDGDAGIGRAVARGAVAGFIVIGGAVAAVGAALGMEPGAAAGFGAFVGSWGGAGFGAMIGGVSAFSRRVEAERHS